MINETEATYQEQLVGMAINDPDVVLPKIREDWFIGAQLQTVVRVAKAMHAESKPIDNVTLGIRLREIKHPELQSLIARLSVDAMPIGALDHYLDFVIEKAKERTYKQIGMELEVSPENGDEIIADAPNRIPRRITKMTVEQTFDEIVDEIERMIKTPGALLGAETGFKSIDDITGGLEPGMFVILAARPSVGKTTLSLNMMLKMSVPTGMISLEMTRKQLLKRLWFAAASVELGRVRRGLDPSELKRLAACRTKIAKPKITDACEPTIGAISAEARSLAKEGVQVLFIDYFQLIKGERIVRSDNRVTEMTYVSNSLKRLAKELRLPLVVACQLNREAAKDGVEPQLYHLRDTGALEQDADVVIMLGPDKDAAKPSSKLHAYVRKNRDGPLGNVVLEFDKKTARIDECTEGKFADVVPPAPPTTAKKPYKD